MPAYDSFFIYPRLDTNIDFELRVLYVLKIFVKTAGETDCFVVSTLHGTG
jgi:hypothetical protein